MLPAVGLVGGWLAGWLVQRFAPEASGSGIPQVKAVLAKVTMALNLRVAVVKLLSGILTLGSGLALGREGPTVQVGASLANQFSAVIRVPITGIVIIFEMTADFNLVLPLMIGSITAYLTGEALSPGSLYDRLLTWRGIRLEEDAPSKWVLAGLTASDVMANPVEVINSNMSLAEVVKAFSQSARQGFPVVEQQKGVGMINQRDISDLAYRFQSTKELSGESEIGEYIHAPPITAGHDISLLKVLSLLDRHQLNRLPIVKEQQLVGIITRSDIIRVEVERLAEKGFIG